MESKKPVDPGLQFMQSRESARMQDQHALMTAAKTAEELQRENSLLPENFWTEATVDWKNLAYGKPVQS